MQVRFLQEYKQFLAAADSRHRCCYGTPWLIQVCMLWHGVNVLHVTTHIFTSCPCLRVWRHSVSILLHCTAMAAQHLKQPCRVSPGCAPRPTETLAGC